MQLHNVFTAYSNYIILFTTKLVVSHCVFANFEWAFCSVSHLRAGRFNANHNATQCPAWSAKTSPEDDSGLLKNSEANRDDERQTLLYSLARDNNKKDKKNLRRKLVDYCPKKSITSKKPWNTKTNKLNRNPPITIKHVFPKMIVGKQKHENPSKFTKRAARNEFRCKSHCCSSFPLPFDIFLKSSLI